MADSNTEDDELRPFLHRWQYVIALLGVVTAAAIGVVRWGGSDDEASPDVDTVTAEGDGTTRDNSRSTTSRATTSTTSSSITTASTTVLPFEHFVPGSTELPAAMAGTWEGMLTEESEVRIFPAHLELHPAPRGRVDVGTLSFPTFSCSGTVELGKVESDHILVNVTWDPNDDCIDGIVQLTYISPTEISYAYQGGADTQGTLTRL
jgi:hypothetical protein